MTRSNLHITLSNVKQIICVADSSTAPEQGYIVEKLFQPLLACENYGQELDLLENYCSMDDRSVNATYRYYINLITKDVEMYEENYNYKMDRFSKGEDLTNRYTSYVEKLKSQDNGGTE